MPPNDAAEALRGEWGIAMSVIDGPQQEQTAQKTDAYVSVPLRGKASPYSRFAATVATDQAHERH